MQSQQKLIDYNTRKHDQIAEVEGDQSYDARHIEIFNPTEQRRLRKELDKAIAERRTDNPRILDFGCGTGNLTSKLLGSGREVCAADVSGGMCELVRRRFPDALAGGGLITKTMTGEFPLPFPDNHFGFIATYSVLHHVPDYETAVRELVRVLDHGGVLYIDHEASTDSWSSPLGLRLYRLLQRPWFGIPRLAKRLAGKLPPEVSEPRNMDDLPDEGDIHIFAHDHIEWEAIRQITSKGGLTELVTKDYLACSEIGKFPVRHLLCKRICNNTGIYVGIKNQ
ncbi:methyltransferase domain-containing protein [Akkermansiaceae bacterium]|nr:methyltransferase domain-containing protein [Akkermansiaceae bacterium]